MKYDSIEALIREEQYNSNGSFIRGIDIDGYLNKLSLNAEIITHYIKGRCAGFVAFYCNDPENEYAFITMVLVANDFRGQGLSKKLIGYALSVCEGRGYKTCGLEVNAENLPAINLYEKMGFVKSNEKEGKILMLFDFKRE